MSSQPVEERPGSLIEQDPVRAISNATERIRRVLAAADSRACEGPQECFVKLARGQVEEELALIEEAAQRLLPT